MLDILEDSTEDEMPTHQSLELDRIKERLRSIWNQIVIAHCKEMGVPEKDKESYIKEHSLYFAGDPEPEMSEVDNLVQILDQLLDPQEDLDRVPTKGKAPSYKGSELKANKERLPSRTSIYSVEHTTTSIPKDKKVKLPHSKHEEPKRGKEPKSNVHERSSSMSIRPIQELLEEERRKLLKIALRRNKEYGVIAP
jgi:hypothetical protein